MLGVALAGITVDGYAEAARERRRTGAAPAPHRRTHLTLLVGVALLGLLMTLAVVQTRASQPEVAAEQAALVNRVQRQTATTDALSARTDALGEQVARLRSRALTSTAAGDAMSRELVTLGTLAGATQAVGPGLVITVDDANPESGSGLPDNTPDPAGRILDIDLQHLVNGLWAAGAEAIAINGQRLTATTAIRAAGEAITVDYRPLARPYTVTAIGDPKTLQARFLNSPGGDWMLNLKATHDIVFDIGSQSSLTLPGDNNTELRFAKPDRSR
jgi:uncharacterized protein YlxW (UPF0749 family)